jgi:hypothetical protein
MKKMFTTVLVLAGVMLAAGSASAQYGNCEAYAQAEMNRLYPLGAGAAGGAVAGGVFGGLIAGATGGNVGTGIGAGAAGGAIIGGASYTAKRQAAYNAALQRCYAGGANPPPPPPQPANVPAGQFVGTVYVDLNVRAGGGTGFQVLFVLHPGQQFTAICGPQSGYPGWCYVTLPNGQAGYASQKYIYPV